MKVLFIGPNLSAGGAERQWSILLPGLRERGFDARVIGLDAGGPMVDPLRRRGVPVEVLQMRHQADLKPLLRSRLVRGFIPDVVVTRGVSGLYVGQAIASRRAACHVYNDHRAAGLRFDRRREFMVRMLGSRLDLVVACSQDLTESWVRRGVARERIVVIANGVEAGPQPESRSAVRSSLGLPDDAVVAVLVASLRREKRVPDFVRAVIATRKEQSNLLGLVAGDGSERQAVERAARDERGIRLLGHVEDVAGLLSAADIFVLTSEHEALPVSILEAMAAGLPVLSTDVGNVAQLVVPGETGMLVPAGDLSAIADALTKLASDAALRKRLGAAGLTRQQTNWGAQAMIDSYAASLSGLHNAGKAGVHGR